MSVNKNTKGYTVNYCIEYRISGYFEVSNLNFADFVDSFLICKHQCTCNTAAAWHIW